MNNFTCIGRLTKDPDLRYTQSGKAVCNFDIAVSRPFKKNETDFFRVVVWGKIGENCANYLSKGSQVGISGYIQNNTWENQNGEKRTRTEIIANTVEFLGGGNKQNNNTTNDTGIDNIEDDDIPF